MSKRLSAGQVEIFARNYYERVSNTPDRIALAFLHMTDTTARAETVENLYDDSIGNDPRVRTYEDMMRYDTATIVKALGGKP